MKVQIITIAICSGIKLLLNIILISNSKIGIYGAAISNVISYILTFIILIIYMIKCEKINFEIRKFIFKPAIIVFSVYIIMKETYKILILDSQLIRTSISIGISMILYLILIIVLRVITRKEIKIIMKKGNINPKNPENRQFY